MDPSEHQGKRNGDGDDTSPHDQNMCNPTQSVPAKNKEVRSKVTWHSQKPLANVARQIAWVHKNLPTPFPVECGWRSLQPHRIAVRYAECGEENRKCIPHQRRIEVREIARTEDDQCSQNSSKQSSPRCGFF